MSLYVKTGPYVVPPPESTVRHIRSEILLVWRGKDGWLARRRILSVNGTDVPSPNTTHFDVLASEGVDRLLDRPAVVLEPTPLLKIGAAVPVFDFPIWPIAVLDSSERSRLGFTIKRASASVDHVRVDGKHGDVDTEISFLLDANRRIVRSEVTAHLPTAVAQLSAEFENNRSLQLVVPRKMSERYQYGLENVTSEIVYSNLRRFDRSGHAVPSGR